MPDSMQKMYLHDKDFMVTVLPYTASDIVLFSNGDNLDTVYTRLNTRVSTVENQLANLDLHPQISMAGAEDLGGVRINGETITIDSNGFINAVYPTASRNSKGMVQVGARLSIENGVLSADLQSVEVDNNLNSTSENPVQNKVIYEALQNVSASANLDLTSTEAILALFTDENVAYYMGDNYLV